MHLVYLASLLVAAKEWEDSTWVYTKLATNRGTKNSKKRLQKRATKDKKNSDFVRFRSFF